ncbi:Pxl1p [Sugiyamaella lignohabitans]|uniref:Pxl1p n=1 Tax=Sugiyamaella lignohabitans TaxID=796027 RepID=A0A161HHY1_9ASCO|nr:Pxl1p [Sugiyamaella lignohabitans]ANB15770.1 Pxl1p [Sugiyamaella lignohabitans]
MQDSAFPQFLPGVPVKSVYERAGFDINKEKAYRERSRPSSRATSSRQTSSRASQRSGAYGSPNLSIMTGSFGSSGSPLPSPRLPNSGRKTPQSPLFYENTNSFTTHSNSSSTGVGFTFESKNHHKASDSGSSISAEGEYNSNTSTPHTSHSSTDSMSPLSGLRITKSEDNQVPEIPPRKNSHHSLDRINMGSSRASNHSHSSSDARSDARSSRASSRSSSRNGSFVMATVKQRTNISAFSSIDESSDNMAANEIYVSALSSPPSSSTESIFSTANEMSSSTSSTSLENVLKQVPEEDSMLETSQESLTQEPYQGLQNYHNSGFPEENSVANALLSASKKHRNVRPKICRGCNEQIIGKCVSSQDGRVSGKWHRLCFTCHRCSAAFESEFYVLNDLPYCDFCYHIENDSICQGCGHGIEGECLETSSAPRTRKSSMPESSTVDDKAPDDYFKRYHPGCLSCSECKNVIIDEEYYIVSGTTLCAMHAFTYREGATSPEMEKRQTRLMMM